MSDLSTTEAWETHTALVLGRLEENQRRWVAGLLSEVLGWGGTKQIAQLSGLDPKTIRQGRLDLANALSDYPPDRVRRAGAGRPSVKKRPATGTETDCTDRTG